MSTLFRPTMADLIDDLRVLIQDPASATATWTDLTLQRALDRHGETVRRRPLTVLPDVLPGGIYSYVLYRAEYGAWESGATIQRMDGTVLVEDTDYIADYNRGEWTLTTSRYPPLFLTGRTYDLYATAADLLDIRATAAADSVDFSEDGQSIKQSQQGPGLRAQAAAYRAQARSTAGDLINSGAGPYAPPVIPPRGRRIPRVYP